MKRKLARLWRKTRRLVTPAAQLSAAEHAHNGDIARNSGDWKTAKSHYILAVARKPDFDAIWVQLGHAHKQAGDLEQAESAYRSAVAANPDSADAWLQLGHLLKSTARPEAALSAFERAVDADEMDPYARREADALRPIASSAESSSRSLISARVPTPVIKYEDAPRTTRHITIDITGADDLAVSLNPDLIGAFENSSCGSQIEIARVRWDEKVQNWVDETGVVASVRKDTVLMVSGPWTRPHSGHIEALRHVALHNRTRLDGLFFDLQPFLRPDFLADAARQAAASFLDVCRALGSGAVGCEGVTRYELSKLFLGAGEQIASIPLSSASDSACQWGKESPLMIVSANQDAWADLQQALDSLPENVVARICRSDKLQTSLCGAMFFSASVHDLKIASLLVAAGIPIAVADDPGFSSLFHVAEVIFPAGIISQAIAAIEILLSLTRPSDARLSNDPTERSSAAAELWEWKTRLPASGRPAPTIFGEDVEEEAAFSVSPITLFPGTDYQPEGILLSSTGRTTLGVHPATATKRGETVALLLSAPKNSAVVRIGGPALNRQTVDSVRRMSAGDTVWVHCPVASDATSLDLTIQAGLLSGTHDPCVFLHASYTYPTGRSDLWWRFLDDIGRGRYPALKRLVQATRH